VYLEWFYIASAESGNTEVDIRSTSKCRIFERSYHWQILLAINCCIRFASSKPERSRIARTYPRWQILYPPSLSLSISIPRNFLAAPRSRILYFSCSS